MNAEQTMINKPITNNNDAGTAPVEQTRGGHYFRPPVDIVERENELVVRADMPGVPPDAVDVHFEDGVLTIEGHVSAASAAERSGTDGNSAERNYLLREYGLGDYYRSFQVSNQVDASQITAEMAGGVLTLTLPKAAAARPRKIVVQGK